MKRLITILLVLTLCYTQAAELDFGYSESNGSRVIHVKNKIPFIAGGFEIAPMQRFESSNKGNLFNFAVNAGKNVNDRWDVFANADYLDDEVLGIKQRLDYKLGAGYEIYNDYEHRHKLSYALIYRSGRFLNSWRYKYEYTSTLLTGKLIFYLITPDDEIRGELTSAVKIFKSLSFVLNHRYATKGDTTNYMITAGFKVSY